MIRETVAVIVGYLVMAVFVFVAFSLAYLGMGTEGAFKANSYEVSALWVMISIVLGVIAAILGGYVCASISKSAKTPMILAGIVLVLGLIMAFPSMMDSDQQPVQTRQGEVGNMEAMQNAVQPSWMTILNPIIGAVGIVLGARLKGTPEPATEAA